MAVANPTSVLHKTQSLLKVPADILVLAETSAVTKTQEMVSKEMRHHQRKVHWGCPVPSHTCASSTGTSLRGVAGGVAIVTSLPSHAPRPLPDPSLLDTCRYAEAIVRIGPLTVRVIAVYGKPSCHSDARDVNQGLLHSAYERVACCRLPAIIAGDFNFNEPITDIPAGQAFLSKGFQEVFHMHHSCTQTWLPPTCKGSTQNDTMLIDPVLLPFWNKAWVMTDQHLFDAHAPLCLSLRAPHERPSYTRWDLPNPWAQHEPHPSLVRDFFRPRSMSLKHQIERCTSQPALEARKRPLSATQSGAAPGSSVCKTRSQW